jgi:hypothetical protein
MSIPRRIAQGTTLLLVLGACMSMPKGLVEKPVMAQINSSYMFCYATIAYGRKGDPLPSGSSVPFAHHYYSELYQGPDRGKEFLAWLHKHYEKEWIYNGYSLSYGDSVICRSSDPDTFANNVKKERSSTLAQWETFTLWPAVTDPQ